MFLSLELWASSQDEANVYHWLECHLSETSYQRLSLPLHPPHYHLPLVVARIHPCGIHLEKRKLVWKAMITSPFLQIRKSWTILETGECGHQSSFVSNYCREIKIKVMPKPISSAAFDVINRKDLQVNVTVTSTEKQWTCGKLEKTDTGSTGLRMNGGLLWAWGKQAACERENMSRVAGVG